MTDVSTQELLDAVKLATDVRLAQKQYFRTRAHDDLNKSKQLERALDTSLANINTGDRLL